MCWTMAAQTLSDWAYCSRCTLTAGKAILFTSVNAGTAEFAIDSAACVTLGSYMTNRYPEPQQAMSDSPRSFVFENSQPRR